MKMMMQKCLAMVFGVIRSRCFQPLLLACMLLPAVAAGITRMDYPDADTVVLDDCTRVEYAADGTYTVENDEKILALTEKGRRSLRTVTIGVSRRYGDAEIVKIEIIGTNGTVRTVDFRKTRHRY